MKKLFFTILCSLAVTVSAMDFSQDPPKHAGFLHNLIRVMRIRGTTEDEIGRQVEKYAKVLATMNSNQSMYGTILQEQLRSIFEELYFSEQIKNTLLAPYCASLSSFSQ